jgi:hypothetical protein
MAVASTNYTHTTWLIIWGSGSLVESKGHHYIMVEAYSHLKLLPASTLDTYKVFEHIDMLFMGKLAVASNSYTHNTWLIFWDSGFLVE